MSPSSIDRRSLVAGTVATGAAAALAGSPAVGASALASGRARRPDPMSPARLHRRVRELCDFQPRWAGYRAERQAGAWLARRLRDAGLEVEVDRYTFRKWQLDGWRTTLLSSEGRRELPSFPLWSSAAGRGTAPLVDVGLGTEPELVARDLGGAVAVVTGRALLNVFASYPDTYHRAAELGAVAMVVTSDAPDNLVRPTSSSRNLLDDNPIPAFQLGAQDLAAVREAAGQGGRLRYRLAAEHRDGTTRDVVGRLRGSGEQPGTVLVCAHYDAWFTGALDNATGVAGLIGLAEHFAALPRSQRPRDMVFVGVTGHDAGYPHLGLHHFVESRPELMEDVDLFVNLDHLAAHGEEHVSGTGVTEMLGLELDLGLQRPLDEERALFTSRHPALAATFLPHLAAHGIVLTAAVQTIPEVNANGDLEGLVGALGVPSVNLTMATPHYHTVEDTPSRIPARQLARCVRAHRDFLTEAMALPREVLRAGIGL